MNNLDLQNKKVAVLGMGVEGLALVDFLLDKNCTITVLDKLSEEEISLRITEDERKIFGRIMQNNKIARVFGDNYLDSLKDFDIVFRSPGISFFNEKLTEAKDSGVAISSQIKLFFDLCPCKIIGVTGTKGKGTTSSLIYEIMKRNFKFQISNVKSNPNAQMTNEKINHQWQMENDKSPEVYLAGNIGYPAISLIPKLKPEDFVILELSSFQLMDLEKSPQIAVVTNVLIDHLDYHKDEAEYRSAKENIVKYQTENDIAILNIKSTFDQTLLPGLKSHIKYFGPDENCQAEIINDSVILNPNNRKIEICKLSEIQLFGRHNLDNIAAATLVADILNIDIEVIKQVVKEFKGLPHRLEFVAEINSVKYINDSFATNPEPTMAAIDSFSEDKILILGGSSKGADFTQLAKKIAGSNISAVILIGDEASNIEKALTGASYSGRIKKGLRDIDEIVKTAQEGSKPREVIILSPACASFGLFKNYKDRGDKFKTAVLNLSQ